MQLFGLVNTLLSIDD
jgi:FKBP12-rapamycin complex-associated protein